MNNESDRIIELFSECFDENEQEIRKLFNQTRNDEFLGKLKNAALLIKAIDFIENALDEEYSKLNYPNFIKGTIQLSLLVSAVETIGSPKIYMNFHDWLNKTFFHKDKNFRYSKRELNRAWNAYNQKFGSSGSFRKVILNSGCDSLISQFIISQELELREDLENQVGLIDHEEKIQIQDLKNPKDLINAEIPIFKDGNIYFLRKNNNTLCLIKNDTHLKTLRQKMKGIEPIDTIPVLNPSKITDFQVSLRSLNNCSNTIQLKTESIEKFMRLKLDFLYHLRSEYYHSGNLKMSEKGDVTLKPWRPLGRKETYIPTLKTTLICSFRRICTNSIISLWKQNLELQKEISKA